MKKVLFLIVLTAMFLVVSCGGDKKTENPDADETVTDEDSANAEETGDNDPDDTEVSDTASDTSDSTDDSADSSTDDTDSATDTTTPDDDSATSEQGRKQGELYGECYPNNTCNEGLVCDIEENVCIKDPGNPEEPKDDSDNIENTDNDTDTDSGDPASDEDVDIADSGNDSGDSTADEDEDVDIADSDDDSGDSISDEDADGSTEDIPDCAPTTGETPCKDPIKGWIWSKKSSEAMTWEEAVRHCDNMNEGDSEDWHLPNISELRTLIKDCSATEVGGACSVTANCLSDDCWSENSCFSCTSDINHSKLGDSGWFWSSSTRAEHSENAWGTYFGNGRINYREKSVEGYVRCVKRNPEEGDIKTTSCTGLPEKAVWNTVSTINQIWDGSAWVPSRSGIYNETGSSTECRFKCDTDYSWNSSNSTCVITKKQANCSSKPTNSVWNDNGANGKFTQTWNGSTYTPASYTSTYNTTAGICRYKCPSLVEYYWNGSTCNKLPECSSSSGTPCYDSTSKLSWSKKASDKTVSEAKTFCNGLNSSNYGYSSGWRLPTISELRTLVKNCPSMMTGGACSVTDSCLSYNTCYDNDVCGYNTCASDSSNPGKYSKFNEDARLWSSSKDGDWYWTLNFYLMYPVRNGGAGELEVRCVRK